MGYQYQVDVAGVMYGMKDLESVDLSQPLFDQFSVGNACAAELDITLWPKAEIPRMAKIVPYCRASSAESWYQLGIFWLDTRKQNGDKLEITAYDVMLKGESVWRPDQDLVFPMTMERAAREAARLMGTSLDSRCSFIGSYTIDYPANNYTLRDILRYIAGAHMGNWIVTNTGQLLLVPLFAAQPPETHYLIEEKEGRAITFGGTRILI